MEVCKVCNRQHRPDQACSQRIANAYTMQVGALSALTEVDKKWMASVPGFSVLDVVEQAVADNLGQ